VHAAIADTRLVLELVASRYADPSACAYPEALADHVSNFGLFVGPSVRGGLDATLTHLTIEMIGPGGSLLKIDGAHPDGHPLRPLVWLAGFLAARGMPLLAGQVVTTGSYAGLVEAPVGVPLSLRFGDLGSLTVELAAA
jgi:2-keto-4-pentenoate hydratase